MKDVVKTVPSYDFTYKFTSLEGKTSTSASSSGSTSAKGGADVVVPLEVPIELGVNLDVTSKYTYSGGVKLYYHRILVEINMDSYYSSVDEAKSELSESVAAMLSAKDIPGFFNSCGTYYVRSLGRNSKFISVFTYLDTSVQADMSFERELKAEISAFKIVRGLDVSQTSKSSFSTKASLKRLTIDTMAFGLGKNKEASLISYDLESFKAAIRDAFISMQNVDTGKVSSMEVVPWIENTQFQKLIKLEEVTTDPSTGKTMTLYRKKHNLELNSEFLAEIERADRNMLNNYYKAKICRKTIDANWKKDGQFYPGMGDSMIINNKFPEKQIKLSELDKVLSESEIEKLLEQEDQFMYGSSGAQKCIDSLMDASMFKKSWRKIPLCSKFRSKFAAVLGSTIDDYCMPTLAPIRSNIEPKPQEKKAEPIAEDKK